MASKFQLRRLRSALVECGQSASSEQLYEWMSSQWPKKTGFRSAAAVGKIRKQLQPGWGPEKRGRQRSPWIELSNISNGDNHGLQEGP